MAISEDLRIRIVRKVASGLSRRQAAALFEVGPSSAIRFAKRYAEEGTLAIKPRPPRKRRLDPFGEDIRRWIAAQPDMTLEEISTRLLSEHDVKAPTSTIDDWLKANKLTYKKNRARQ